MMHKTSSSNNPTSLRDSFGRLNPLFGMQNIKTKATVWGGHGREKVVVAVTVVSLYAYQKSTELKVDLKQIRKQADVPTNGNNGDCSIYSNMLYRLTSTTLS